MNNNHKFATFYVALISVALAGALYANNLNSAKVFVFTWSEEEQDIVNGTLRVEISFQWKGENLTIIAKINDGKAHGFYETLQPSSLLLLVFDRNGNGKLDAASQHPTGPEPEPVTERPYLFFSTNNLFEDDAQLSYTVGIIRTSGITVKSPYHTCTFKEGIGFTYKISIPKTELAKIKINNAVVVYKGYAFWHYGMDWVYTYIEGWQ